MDEQPKSKPWSTSIIDNDYEILVVSQFTLFGWFKGTKPQFNKAMQAELALQHFNSFVEYLKTNYKEEKIKTGAFGQHMEVESVNDGPVTLILE